MQGRTYTRGLGIFLVASIDARRVRLLAAEPSSTDEWSHLGGDAESHQYSSLAQITSQNVHSLGLLWYSNLPIPEGLIGNPLVMDGRGLPKRPLGTRRRDGHPHRQDTLGVRPAPRSFVLQRAALRSRQPSIAAPVWTMTTSMRPAAARYLPWIARPGSQVWQAKVCEPGQDLGADSAPRVGDGKVFVGITNMQSGTNRGYAAAFDARTGKELWRFYTVPGDPSKPYENSQMATAAKTWGNRYWADSKGSGGVWEGMVYDPQTRLLIFGAGNPGVDGHEAEFAGKAMLYADSLIAVNASTGQYAWHVQETTGDVFHPGDATAHLQLADLQINGRLRHVVMQAAKNGYFYVIDAKSGQVISADEYGIPDTNFEPVDKETGTVSFRKSLAFWNFPEGKKEVMQPGGFGAHTWELCSYNPETGLVYIPAFVFPYELTRTGREEFAGFAQDAKYKNHGVLIAWDPLAKAERWHVDHPITINGGVLSTAGGVVFQGTPGKLYAYDAKSGETLWSFDTHSIVLGAPSTVMVQGKQILLVPSGDGNAVASSKTTQLTTTPDTVAAPSRLLAFAIDGKETLPPPAPKMIRRPPLPRQPRETAELGRALFEKNGCGSCHGAHLVVSGNGRIPDLRNVPEPLLRLMPQILRDGIFRSAGMPRFTNFTDQQIEQLQAYITDAAWDAYDAQAKSTAALASP